VVRNEPLSKKLIIKIKSMKNIKEKFLQFIKHPKLEAFLWQTLNGFLAISIVIISDLEWQFAPIIIAGLNFLTKWVNTQYIKKS
jgi:hypothetical protein